MARENRRFLRMPVSEGARTAILQFDGLALLCELVNESSGGYAVALPEKYLAKLPAGRLIVMEVSDLLVKVRVAHTKEEDGRLCLGLERIAELEDKLITRREQWSWLTPLTGSSGQSVKGPGSALSTLSILGALAATMVFILGAPNLSGWFKETKKNRRTTNWLAFELPSWRELLPVAAPTRPIVAETATGDAAAGSTDGGANVATSPSNAAATGPTQPAPAK